MAVQGFKLHPIYAEPILSLSLVPEVKSDTYEKRGDRILTYLSSCTQ